MAWRCPGGCTPDFFPVSDFAVAMALDLYDGEDPRYHVAIRPDESDVVDEADFMKIGVKDADAIIHEIAMGGALTCPECGDDPRWDGASS